MQRRSFLVGFGAVVLGSTVGSNPNRGLPETTCARLWVPLSGHGILMPSHVSDAFCQIEKHDFRVGALYVSPEHGLEERAEFQQSLGRTDGQKTLWGTPVWTVDLPKQVLVLDVAPKIWRGREWSFEGKATAVHLGCLKA